MNAFLTPFYSSPYSDRCAKAFNEAIYNTEAYRQWRQFDSGKDHEIFIRFRRLPSLTKACIQRLGPQAFVPHGRDVPEGLDSGAIELVATSGTTHDRVTNIWYQPWWNASEAASWKLNRHARQNATGEHREAILTSPYCAGFPCEKGGLSMKERTLGRFLFLTEHSDPALWSENLMNRMVDELNQFRPVILEANPSFLARLSRHITRKQQKVFSPALIVLTYENPSLLHCRQIKKAFESPLASSYGATEAGYVFMECEHGTLHQITENVHVEFLPFLPEHGGPEIGRILVSTFNNPWRALIRFDIGDVVRLKPLQTCACGHTEGIALASVEGRTVNLTLTPEGRAVTQGRIDRHLSRFHGLAEYQLVQTKSDEYLLKYAIDQNENILLPESELKEALKEIYGDRAGIHIEHHQNLHPHPPGKYRLTHSEIPVDADALLDPLYAPRKSERDYR